MRSCMDHIQTTSHWCPRCWPRWVVAHATWTYAQAWDDWSRCVVWHVHTSVFFSTVPILEYYMALLLYRCVFFWWQLCHYVATLLGGWWSIRGSGIPNLPHNIFSLDAFTLGSPTASFPLLSIDFFLFGPNWVPQTELELALDLPRRKNNFTILELACSYGSLKLSVLFLLITGFLI